MSDFLDSLIGTAIAWIIGLLAVVAALLCAVGVPSFYSERYECGQIPINTGTETKFVKNHILSWDCYVKVDDKWIPLDKWRGDAN